MQNFETVDDYLANLPAGQKSELTRIRTLVKKLVPESEESISYGIPAFKFKNKPLIYYAAFKDHLSVFPTTKPPQVLQDKLKDFKQGKGTIQFTLEKPLNDELIGEIVSIRKQEILEKHS